MRTEDDLRVAFRDMERLTPDAADVLRAVYDHPRRPVRSWRLPPRGPRRHALRAGLALGAAGAVAAAAVIAVVGHGPATKAGPIAAPALRARLLAAIDTASGDILYTPAPGAPLGGGQYPAYPRPGQEVHVRVGPAVGSDGKVYKDGEYSFTMPSETALHHYINHYTADLDQGGLQLSGTAMSVDHFTARLETVPFDVHPRVHPRRGRYPRRDRQRPVHGYRADRTERTAGHRAEVQRAAQQRSPAPCDSGAHVGERHDLPADAGCTRAGPTGSRASSITSSSRPRPSAWRNCAR